MSYFDRLQKYKERIDANRPMLDPVNPLSQLPPDETKNIFSDKINLMNDKLAEDATAPITAIGGADLLRRGVKALPVVKDINDAWEKSKEFRGKVSNLLGDERVQQFLKDPEGTLNSLAGDVKAKLLDAVNQGVSNVSQKVGQGIQESILGSSAPPEEDPENADLQRQLDESYQDSTPGPTQTADDDEDLQRQLDESYRDPAQTDGADEMLDAIDQTGKVDSATQRSLARQARLIDSDAFKSDWAFGKGADGGVEWKEPQSLGEGIESTTDRGARLAALQQRASTLKGNIDDTISELKSRGVEFAGSGDQLDAQRATSQLGQSVKGTGPDDVANAGTSEAADIDRITSQQQTADGLQADIASEVKAGAGSSVPDADLTAGGEEGAEEGTGLAIGEAIPGIGEVLDLAGIGAIIGEAVKTYKDKQDLAKRESEQAEREQAIQKDIVNEQSSLVGEARQQAAQQPPPPSSQNNVVPVSQVGSDR